MSETSRHALKRTARITAITAATGWIVGLAAILLPLLMVPTFRITLNDLVLAVLVYGAYVAGVVLPVSFCVVAPLVHFLDARPVLAHPAVSTIMGSLVGIVAPHLVLFAALSPGHFELPDFHDSATWIFAGVGALGGASSGFACARQIRKDVADNGLGAVTRPV